MSRSGLATLGVIVGVLALSFGGCVAQEAYAPASAGAAGTGAGTQAIQAGSLNLAVSGGAPGDAGSATDTFDPTVACFSSSQCAPPLPYCEPPLGRCVECTSNANCLGTDRVYCDTKSNSCVKCLSDLQCTRVAPYCATSIGECAECISSANCGGNGLACDRLNFRCVPTCRTNADCSSSALTPFCDPVRSLCVECVNDDSCPAATAHCELTSNTCVKCLVDADCPAAQKRCDARKRACVACLTNRDCQAGATCVAGACSDPK